MNKKLVLKNSIVGLTILVSSIVVSAAFADDDSVVDQINITVPVSCTMSGTGMQSHNAEITNGTYQADIGSTTLHAFCNDNNGFAIYAAGYTGDEIGGTSSNKLVGTVASGNATIDTGLATSAGNPDVSNWAMKLAISQDSGDTTGTNAFTIDNSFGAYHAVPNDYMKVAHKDSNTDMTASTGGVKLTTTYAAYISKTQPADTYSGQVVYTLVHPATTDPPVHPDQIGVNYYENGLGFSSGLPKNRVIYDTVCTTKYIVSTPTIVKTSNLNNDGTQNGSYTDDEEIEETLTFDGASKIKVILNYNMMANTAELEFYSGDWDDEIFDKYYDAIDMVGQNETFLVDSDTITLAFYSWEIPESGRDYGLYAQIYPIYDTEQSDTEEYSDCVFVDQANAYSETTNWNGRWVIVSNGEASYLADENEINDYLNTHHDLAGSSIDIYAYNPYLVNYNGNGATAGTMAGFTSKLATNDSSSSSELIAPNFKKTGYGFAGWSKDPNATINGSSKIYGPNETIRGNELTFDPNTREATLYAIWVAPSGNMQNFSCSSLAPGKVTALTDTRDNNVYTVGKLQDGNCWMMENLRLDNTATLDSANTDNPVTGFTLAASSDDWCTAYTESCINQNKINTNNVNIGGTNASGTTLVATPGGWDAFRKDHEDGYWGEFGFSGKTYQWYSYGNKYNWYTATAGNGTYNISTDNQNINGSICPSGWTLPTGGDITNKDNSDWWKLAVSVIGAEPLIYFDDYSNDNGSTEGPAASKALRAYPNNLVYSGLTGGSRGYVGSYWSRSAFNNNFAYSLSVHSTDVYLAMCTVKLGGPSVRCLASGS